MSSTMTPCGRLATSKAMRSSKPLRSTRSLQVIVPPGRMIDSPVTANCVRGSGTSLVPADVRCTITFGLSASLIVPRLLTSFVRSWPQTVAVAVIFDRFELLFGRCGCIGVERIDDARGFVQAVLNDDRRGDLKAGRQAVDVDANRAVEIVDPLGLDRERLAAAGVDRRVVAGRA